jgi:Na+/H+-translocating membrane pyrophosphatase
MIPLVMIISVLSLAFAGYLARWVLAADTGTPAMQEIASAIKEGAEAFLRRQNRTIIVIGILVAAVIFVLYAFVRPPTSHDPTTPINMAWATTLAFLFGAFCSGISGYVGMFVSIRANLRTASAVRTSLNRALQIALRGGAVSGLFVVAMSLLGVGGLFVVLRSFGVEPVKIPLLIVGYGFGASLVALFAQLGGGI